MVSGKPWLPFPLRVPNPPAPWLPSGPKFHLYGLEDPLPEVTDFGVDAWLLGQGAAGAPAHDATQPPTWRPRDAVLTHEGATAVTLVGDGRPGWKPRWLAEGPSSDDRGLWSQSALALR